MFISKSTAEDWLQVGASDDSKTFTVEEVNLPYNAEDGETVVTFGMLIFKLIMYKHNLLQSSFC